VEFWAKLGRAIEPLLDGPNVLALCRNAEAQPLSECLNTIDSPEGRRRLAGVLDRQPYPHYLAHTEKPGFLVRIEANGHRTVGRFVKRQFVTTLE